MIIKILLAAVISVEFCTSQLTDKMTGIHKNVSELRILSTFISRLDNIGKIDLHPCWSSQTIVSFQKLHSGANNHLKLIQQTSNVIEDNQLVHVLDLQCKSGLEMLLQANQSDMFKGPSNWIIIIDSISDFPPELNIFLDSRVYVLQKNDKIVFSLYRQQYHKDYIYQVVGVVENYQLDAFRPVLEFTDRRNIEKTILRVGYVITHNTSFEELLEFGNLEKDHVAKYHIHLVNPLIDLLNATEEKHAVSTWGRMSSAKKFDGLLGLLQNGKIELAASCIYPARDRLLFVGVVTKYPGEAKFVFRSPPLSIVKNILRMPLQDDVWGSIAILLILQFFLLLTIVKWEWVNESQLKLPDKNNVLRPRLLDVAHMQVGALFQQGSEAEPKSASGQIATLFIFLSFLFFYTAYSACIVALLQSTANNINTLDDMRLSDIRVKIDDVPYMPFYIQNALTSDAARALYHTKIAPSGMPENVNYVQLQDGITTCIRDDFCALLIDEDRALKVINRQYTEAEKCRLKTIQWAPETYPYVPYRKLTMYKEVFRVSFARITEVGIRKRTSSRILTTATKCDSAGGIFRSVSLTDCYFALLSFSIGISITILVFVLELIYYKFTHRND